MNKLLALCKRKSYLGNGWETKPCFLAHLVIELIFANCDIRQKCLLGNCLVPLKYIPWYRCTSVDLHAKFLL